MLPNRIKFLLIFFLIFSIAIVIRLFYWQVIEHDRLTIMAEDQHFSAMDIPAKRGEIKTSDGSVLVSNQPAYLVYASIPNLKEKPEEIAKKIAPIFWNLDESQKVVQETQETVGQEEEAKKDLKDLAKEKEDGIKKIEQDLKNKLDQPSLVWVLVRKKVPTDFFEKIKALKIEGIGWEMEQTRFYPEASMAAHLTGFVGSDANGNDKGYFGLEGYYNEDLRGTVGKLRQEIDAQGRPILVGEHVDIPPKDGRDLITTVDRSVQYVAEQKLEEGVKKYGAKSGTVLVMDPKTGGILADASFPRYDQSKWSQYDKDIYKNPAVADTYEPGSTFKTVVMGGGLDTGVVTPDSRCDCSGPREVSGFKIRTWNDKYYPNSTMVEVLQHSDNVGMVTVEDRLGKERFLKYINDFGFGKATGIDLEEETDGILRDSSQWQTIDLATASFGQGIAVTPLQIVRAVGAIANGGKLMQPYVVKKIVDSSKEIEIKPKVLRQVIKPETASTLAEMMVKAVEGGEAKRLIPKGYRVAGKTGTAQIAIEGHYDPKKTIASFVGFAPAEDPKFVMLVKVDEPSSSQWGSETAAPLFFDIAKELFTYYGIPPGQ